MGKRKNEHILKSSHSKKLLAFAIFTLLVLVVSIRSTLSNPSEEIQTEEIQVVQVLVQKVGIEGDYWIYSDDPIEMTLSWRMQYSEAKDIAVFQIELFDDTDNRLVREQDRAKNLCDNARRCNFELGIFITSGVYRIYIHGFDTDGEIVQNWWWPSNHAPEGPSLFDTLKISPAGNN